MAEIAGSTSGWIFIDGSVDTPADPRRHRAGWAVVEVDPCLREGQLVRRRAVWGTAPSVWPQSAQAGEFAAAVAAATIGTTGAIIFSDCAAVLKVMQGDPRLAQHPGRPWAGAYRDAHDIKYGAILMRNMRKVKAHQTERPDEPDDERLLRLGNDWADEKAKCGRLLHPTAVPAIGGSCIQMWRDAQTACETLGKATLEWPDAAGMLGRPRPSSTRQARAEATAANRRKAAERRRAKLTARAQRLRNMQDTHNWVVVGHGRKRCADCLAWHHATNERCTGVTDAWAACIDGASAKGHVLQRGLLHDAGCGSPLHILACAKCGSFTTGIRLQGLADVCHRPTPAGRAAIARLAAGKNPKPGRRPAWFAPCRHG